MARAARVRHPKTKQVEDDQAVTEESPTDQIETEAVPEGDLLAALDGMSSKQLTAVIDQATAVRASRVNAERKEFLDRFRAEAAELGISLDQIMRPASGGARRARSSGKSQAPVKFQGPNEGDTWTGRGRLPNWLAAIEAEGGSRDQFLVDKPAH